MRLPELHGWHLAGLAACLPMLACNTGGGGDAGFRITSVNYDSQNRLILTFSEPIMDPSGVDPNDFRISYGRTSRLIVPGEPVMETVFYTGIGYGGFDQIAPGDSANQLILSSAYGVDFAYYCENINYNLEYYQNYLETYLQQEYPGATANFDLGMFLHYAAGDIPIESEAGETIADVMPDFVLTDGYLMPEMRYGFINYLRIPCP